MSKKEYPIVDSPENFEKALDVLADNGYTVV